MPFAERGGAPRLFTSFEPFPARLFESRACEIPVRPETPASSLSLSLSLPPLPPATCSGIRVGTHHATRRTRESCFSLSLHLSLSLSLSRFLFAHAANGAQQLPFYRGGEIQERITR